MNAGEKITYFGATDFRNRKTKFGIKNSDRSRHVYVIGKTGMGKSTLLENMAAQDIMSGEGMCFVDPHGSAIDVLLEYVPAHRVNDIVYFAPFDTQFPISFNVMENVDADQRHLVMAGLIASFKKIWPDSFSARMEYILANTLLALLEYPGATLLGVNRMLAEKDYRNDVIKNITDASVKAFWIDEYNKWDPRYAREAGAAIQNKIGQFTSNPLIRNIIGQEKTSFDMRYLMDNKKILLVNLSKGRIGESNANLLGGMLITKLYLAAMSRADVGAKNLKLLPDFFFFVDEFQNFANESFADILAEARKYKLNLTVAHQYVEQMQEEVAAAIFGNVGTMISFRIGPTDAEVFEKQFAPTFTAEDIVNLGKFKIYLSLMIDGIGSRPFSASTLGPLPTPETSSVQNVIEHSRQNYAVPRDIVEAKISKWYEPLKTNVQKRNIAEERNKPKEKTQLQKRDFNSSEKKDLKLADEKEAEEEMRKIISPQLNNLLDGLGSKKKEKIKTSSSSKKEGLKKVFVAQAAPQEKTKDILKKSSPAEEVKAHTQKVGEFNVNEKTKKPNLRAESEKSNRDTNKSSLLKDKTISEKQKTDSSKKAAAVMTSSRSVSQDSKNSLKNLLDIALSSGVKTKKTSHSSKAPSSADEVKKTESKKVFIQKDKHQESKLDSVVKNNQKKSIWDKGSKKEISTSNERKIVNKKEISTPIVSKKITSHQEDIKKTPIQVKDRETKAAYSVGESVQKKKEEKLHRVEKPIAQNSDNNQKREIPEDLLRSILS